MLKNENLLVEIWKFLKARKAWWLLPMVIMLILVGILMILGQASPLSPFIYGML